MDVQLHLVVSDLLARCSLFPRELFVFFLHFAGVLDLFVSFWLLVAVQVLIYGYG